MVCVLQKFGPRFDTRVRRELGSNDGAGGGWLDSRNRIPHMTGGVSMREWVFGVLLAALWTQRLQKVW